MPLENVVLIIGAQKCGTSSLFNYLADHPEIGACSQKEPNFFANDSNWSRGWSWYASLWGGISAQHRIAMEASTSYTKLPVFPNAAERIATCPAKFRFIYLLRDPIVRIESHTTHDLSGGSRPNWNHLIAASSYARQLDEYAKRFPREDIKLIVLEELAARPREVVEDVCRFLGIASRFRSRRIGLPYNRNQYRPPQLFTRLGQTRPGRAVLTHMPFALKSALRFALGGNRTGNVPMSKADREAALQELRPDLLRLHLEYGVDIARWGISSSR